LEREGAVESRWEIQASGPARKIYSLTDHGKQKLKSRIADWNSFSSGIAAVLKGAPVYEFSV
jgi:PadR family transcriptional regulator PadR